jgi:hypothetical protein
MLADGSDDDDEDDEEMDLESLMKAQKQKAASHDSSKKAPQQVQAKPAQVQAKPAHQ